MSGFMIIGATSGENIITECFMLHIDEKPYVAPTLEDAVSTAVDYFQTDIEGYIDHSMSIDIENNMITGSCSIVDVQYKIVALDGSCIDAHELFSKELA